MKRKFGLSFLLYLTFVEFIHQSDKNTTLGARLNLADLIHSLQLAMCKEHKTELEEIGEVLEHLQFSYSPLLDDPVYPPEEKKKFNKHLKAVMKDLLILIDVENLLPESMIKEVSTPDMEA